MTLSRRGLITGATAVALARQAAAQQPLERRSASVDPFALGVASGEPDAQGAVLWTRLVGPAGAPLDAPAVPVRWEIAGDEGFRRPLASGSVTAAPPLGHAVHVEVAGQPVGRPFFYRFHALGATSPVGRAATAPVRADRLRIALASCQHWEQGWFSAYRDIIDADIDLILHVGDYVYERSFGTGPTVRRFDQPEPTDLAGYRGRHALYKSDPDLRRAHQAAPWVVTWDDHEVSNDYAGDANIHEVDPAAFSRRRAAAYQAFFEHMPVRPSRWGRPDAPQLFHRLHWGDLATLHVLDGRQHRSPHACDAPGRRGGRPLADCDALGDPERTMLGGLQEAWLADGLAAGGGRWTLLAQQTVFAPMRRVVGGETRWWTDSWDGYPAARARLAEQLARPEVANPVVLSGDVHCWWVNDVPAQAGRNVGPVVAAEFVTSCLASRVQPASAFGDDVLSANPHIRFNDNERCGYIRLDLDRRRLSADLRAMGDVTDPAARTGSLAGFFVEEGRRGVQPR